MNDFLNDPRFAGIEPFPSKVWLSSPTMHGEERKWVDDAILTNWVSTVGKNINVVEEEIAEYVGVKYAVGLKDLMREHFADEKYSVQTSPLMPVSIRLPMRTEKPSLLTQNMIPGIWTRKHLKRLSKSILM